MNTLNKSSRTKNTMYNLISILFGQVINLILQFVVRTVFINTLGKDGFSDVFPIMRKEKKPILEKYNGNLLIVVGTNDSYLNPYSNYEALEKWLKNNFINAKIDYLNLEGETHSFTNNTENIAKKLTEMVLKIL